MGEPPVAMITRMVEEIEPSDRLAVQHRAEALTWLASTSDIYRRVKPRTPSPHLVAYFLLVDRAACRVLLCDHRLSGLWLPTGGHVEPGEHPVDTVRREADEELGIRAHFHPSHPERPFFLTVTETVGSAASRHIDVSLWFAITGHTYDILTPDAREFFGVRWWSPDELQSLPPGRREPHLHRALEALTGNGW